MESIPKLTISDMKTKHGTKWREKPLSTITLTNKDEKGILSLSKTCSLKIQWKPVTFCFSRIVSSKKEVFQSKLKQLGFHYLSSYIPQKTDYLIVSESFDVTPKLLQALIEGIPIITTSFIQELEKSVPSLTFPHPHSHAPCQDSSHVDISPQAFRKTVLSDFAFHFLQEDSPYIDIIPLAGGRVDTTSLQTLQTTHPTSPYKNSIVVYRDPASTSYASSADSLALAMTRTLPPTVLTWVQHGYIPLEEQELMHALLIEGEFKSYIQMNTARCAKEIKNYLEWMESQKDQKNQKNQTEQETPSDETESESEEEPPKPVLQSPMKVVAVKRPELQHGNTNDDLLVEDFFEQLEEAKNQPTFSIQEELLSESQHSYRTKDPDSMEMPNKRRKVESNEEEGWVGETALQESIQESPVPHESVSGGKGKKFVKKQVKRSTCVIQLYPYRPSFVFLNKHIIIVQ